MTIVAVGSGYTSWEGGRDPDTNKVTIGLSYDKLCRDVKPGGRILLADGSCSIQVMGVKGVGECGDEARDWTDTSIGLTRECCRCASRSCSWLSCLKFEVVCLVKAPPPGQEAPALCACAWSLPLARSIFECMWVQEMN